MSNRGPAHRWPSSVFIAIPLWFFGAMPAVNAAPVDYSKEAAVIQDITTKAIFGKDGSREWRQTLSVRIQSEAALRQYGILSFLYSVEDEQPDVEYVRVRKADGSVVETPASSIIDVATTAAPTYIDLRQKQIPVKALGVGDVLEYSFRSVPRKPLASGQFWYEQGFIDDAVVLNQTLEIRVPKDIYVQVSSPNLTAETREEGSQRVYIWKHSHLEPSKPNVKAKAAAQEQDAPKVRLTTFRSWEEVGRWWGTLASEQEQVTPAIQAKAAELTAGRTTDADKVRAIYEYVATQFRYISISFGIGRYRPHSAAEVLANQYGDCKDKHTLFAALLKASGIEVWPALMGVGVKLDPAAPSPAQLNHVITVWPQNGTYVWLDTTAETAPFGFLSQALRDEQALVIPANSKPVLMKTPLDPPFAASEIVNVKSSLTPDGTLKGHFDIRLTGDGAVGLRAGFHMLAPAQWQEFTQQFSNQLGLGGDVTGVEVENLSDLEAPLHYAYEYSKTSYSDWKEHKITPPLPALEFGPGDEAAQPKEAFWAGAPGHTVYSASVELPKGFSVQLPTDTTLSSSFADYSAHYSVKDGVLFAERKMTIKKSKVAPGEWAEYQKFYKGVQTEQNQYILISETAGNGNAIVSQNNAEAEQLIRKAFGLVQAQDVSGARKLLEQAQSLNPKQARLWAAYAYTEMPSGNEERAIADFRKELEYHPEETEAYQALSWLLTRAGRRDEAADTLRTALSKAPQDEAIALMAGKLLMELKRYGEVATLLEKAVAAAPGNFRLQALRVEALLRSGQKEQGLQEAGKLAEGTSDPDILNSIAYALSDTDTTGPLAVQLVQKAIAQTEQQCGKASLGTFQTRDLEVVNELAAEWDTLG